jgi:hypothetical protein
MLRIGRLLIVVLGALLAVLHVPAAAASTNQLTIFEDDAQLHQNLTGTLAELRNLGVTTVRVAVSWAALAPQPNSPRSPSHFDASDPAGYPAAGWSYYDSLVRQANADGIQVDFTLGSPVPRWAEGRGVPRGSPFGSWRPDASEFGAFVKAVGTRYDGRYTPAGQSSPLPAVRFWSVWNEPNYGYDLAPQGADGGRVVVSAAAYRGLLNHAWGALMASGHRGNTILFGETAPHGRSNGGNFAGTAPLLFLRALYCVDSSFRQLRGSLARAEGCPTSAAASRRFRAQNPALFDASGYAAHLYAQRTSPNRSLDDRCVRGEDRADYADLGAVGHLESTLDRLQHAYGSGKRYSVYNTEYGYQTDPPQRFSCSANSLPVSVWTAAYYINWAEYLSYENPRIASFDQYLLTDPPNGAFASGLEYSNGRPKPDYWAFQMPLYMPQSSAKHASSLVVWGGVRPAHLYGPQTAELQFQPGSHGPFVDLRRIVLTSPRGYFDVRQTFALSGTVRLAWADPESGVTYYSRSVAVKVG